MAPQHDPASRTARDLLPLAAVRWRIYDRRRGAQQRHAIRLDHRIQRERRTGLTLAPAAMAAMHEQRFRFEPVAHEAAITAAFDREGAHVVSSRKFGDRKSTRLNSSH